MALNLQVPYSFPEYITTAGNEYINIGARTTAGSLKIELKLAITSAVSQCIISNLRTVGSGNDTFIKWDSTHGFRLKQSGSEWIPADGLYTAINTEYTLIAEFSSNGCAFTVNGMRYSISTGQAAGDRPLMVFADATNGNSDKAYCKLWYVKVWGGGELLDNCVPMVRDSDSKQGLVNVVTSRWHFTGGATVSMYTPWYSDENGEPQSEMFEGYPKKAMQTPYPEATWRIESRINGGVPYHGLLSEVFEQEIIPVSESPYITAYTKTTKQNEFDNNGVILSPTSCYITEVINDKWQLDLTHPCDSEGRWRYIEPSYLVKALGQLFTLRKIQHIWRGNSGSIQATADHVFYQQLDGWVYPGARITGQTGLDMLQAVSTYTERFPGENQTMYYWAFDSDVDIPAGVDYSKWCPTQEGATPIDFIMGNGGLIAMTGGELYRDNFYYSVKKRMENAEDNVFEIRVGKNLKGITRVVDFSQFCIHFTGYDQYGQWCAVSWTDEYAYQFVPHTVIRSRNFNINVDESSLPEDRDPNLIYERTYELLEAEVMAFFNANCAPVVSFKVDIEDVKDNPDFKMFANPDKLKVGNTGRLYDERLGVDMGLKISQTKTDAITGKVVEVTFGTVQSFTGGQNYPAVLTDLIPVPQGGEIPLRDKNGEALFDRNREALMERIVI